MTTATPTDNPAQPQRKITSHDLYQLRLLRDPQIAPDGSRAAFVLTVVDRAENKYRSTIATVALDGSKRVQRLTGGAGSDGHPRWSPNGRYLAFISARGESGERHEAAGGGKPQIWLLPLAGGEARQLTFVRGGVGEFVWSPDGSRICFGAAVEQEELYREQKHARDMGAGKLAAGGLSASEAELQEAEASNTTRGEKLPGGNSEEMTTPVRQDMAEFDSAVDEEKEEQNKTRVISRFSYRGDGQGWYSTERSHLFLIDVPDPEQAYGLDRYFSEHDTASTPRKPADPTQKDAFPKERDPRDTARQLTGGDYDEFGPVWSPDGTQIAFCSNRLPDRDIKPMIDIFLLEIPSPLDGGAGGGFAEPRKLTNSKGISFAPSFSPDGQQLAYYGHQRDGEFGGSFDNRVYVMDVVTGIASARCLTEGFKRSVGHQIGTDMREGVGDETAIWSADGQSIYFPASDRGTNYLFRVILTPDPSPKSGRGETGSGLPEAGLPIQRLTQVGNLSVLLASYDLERGQIVFAGSDPFHPSDLYRMDADGGNLMRLTEINGGLLNSVYLYEPEEVTVERGGVEIQGWLLKPHDFDPEKKYPLVLEIHGGPHSAYGTEFFHELQLLAARGYVVLYTNPRGSQSYGEAYSDAIRGDWGGVDYDDIMALVDATIERGYVDTARMGVTGGSYGGYMTNWIIGHNDRFKAAVTQRCLSNLVSFWGTSDAGVYFGMYELPGDPWSDPESMKWYLDHSPLTYVNNMKTPLLIIHSEQDYRCLVEQAEQMFAALKVRGVETQLVRFPNESHGLNRGGQPRHRIENLERIAGWFDSHL